MQMIGPVIFGQRGSLAIQGELAVSDTVAKTAADRAKERMFVEVPFE